MVDSCWCMPEPSQYLKYFTTIKNKIKIKKDFTSKGNYRPVSLMNTHIKLLKILFSKFEFNNIYKGYYIMTKWGFSWECSFFNTLKLINSTSHIKKLKSRNHMIITTDGERHLTKFNTYNKKSAILEKRIISFLLLLSEVRQRCPPSLLLFNTVLQVLARKIMQEKEIKDI